MGQHRKGRDLTEPERDDIKAMWASGDYLLREIAARFGVSNNTAWRVANKRDASYSYKSVQDDPIRMERSVAYRARALGLESADVVARWRVHDKTCDVCKVAQSELDRSLAIDHDHETGKFRGFLCLECNVALGLVRDNPDLLVRLVEYLSKQLPA